MRELARREPTFALHVHVGVADPERAIELVERSLRRQTRGALDQVALKLTAQVLLEAPQLLAGDAVAARVIGRQVGLRLGSEPERAADPLDVDAEHPRPLASAEGGDRQSREVTQCRFGAVSQRGRDLLAERVEVELVLAELGLALGDALARGFGLGGAEEEALEDELVHAPVLGGLGQRRRERLLEIVV